MSVDQLTIDLVASCDHIITIFCNIDLDDFYRHFLAIVIHKRFIRYKRRIRQIVGNGIFRRYRKCFHFVQCRLSFRIRIGIRRKWNTRNQHRRQCHDADHFLCPSAEGSPQISVLLVPVIKIIFSKHIFLHHNRLSSIVTDHSPVIFCFPPIPRFFSHFLYAFFLAFGTFTTAFL